MTVNSKNIDSLESLDRRIRLLQLRTRELEQQMDEQLEYLQENYSSMMMKSFIPAISAKSGIAGSLIQLVFQNKRLQDSLGKLAEMLFNRISDAVEFIADKLQSKKSKDDL